MNIFQKLVVPLIKLALRNRWFFRLIGIGIFILILYKINWAEFLRIIRQLNPYWVFTSLVLQGIALVVTTWRWKLIMERLDIHVSFGRSFIHQLVGTGVAMVTPGQLGEFVKVLYHRGLRIPVPESALSVLIDRLYDLFMLFVFGFLSLAILFGIQPNLVAAIAIVGGLVTLILFFIIRNKVDSAYWIAAFLARLSPKAYKEMIRQKTRRLARKVVSMSPVFVATCVLLSLTNYTLLVAKVYMLALAVHMDVSFWYIALAVPLCRLAGLLPISVSGIGTRDAMIIYLLSRVGVPAESSLILSLLSLISLEFQALFGILFWWRYPPTLERSMEFFDRNKISGLDEALPEK